MGKARPNRRRKALRRHIGQFDSESLWLLLAAAGASPAVRHKWVRVGHLVELASKTTGLSGRHAEPGVLHDLLERAAESIGNIYMYEDYLPEDPRDNVRVRISDYTLRIGPGDIERPVADIDRALLVSKAIDPLLIDRIGFGVRDLLDVVLGYQDTAIATVAESWPEGDIDLNGDTVVTTEEVESAERLLALGTPEDLLPTDRHRLALNWITCTSAALSYDPGSRQSPVGRFLRVEDPSWVEPRWLPLHFVPGALAQAVGELAAQVATDPVARRRFAEVSAAEARYALWRFGDVFGPPDYEGAPMASPRNVVQWASSPTGRHFVLVQVMSELSVELFEMPEEPETLRATKSAASDPANPRKVSMTYGEMTLRPGAEVVPLLVVASPSHIAAFVRPGLPAVSLDDLRWMSKTADSELDLFNYCRDMSRPDLPQFMGWEAINIWEWWRSNGQSFFSGGQAPSLMMITPHWGTAEWVLGAKRTPVEVALARLGLPPLRDLEADPEDDNVGPRLLAGRVRDSTPVEAWRGRHKAPDPIGWSVHVSEVPVAVEALRTGWPEEQFAFLSDLAIGLSYAFEQITHVWVEAHRDTDVRGYVFNLTTASSGGGEFRLLRTSPTGAYKSPDKPDGVITVEVEVDLDPTLDDNFDVTAAFQGSMAAVIADAACAAGVSRVASDAIKAAIMSGPPTFAVETLRPLTSRNHFSNPVPLNEALVSVVDRKVAEAVSAAGIEPGEYRGTPAKAIDRDVLAPTALAILDAALASHSMDELLQFGMEQIERCLAHKSRAQITAQHATDVLRVGWDPLERLHASESELSTLRRCIELAMEAALRSAPSGSAPVDDLTWSEILAAARVYLAATTRSEAIHHQVGETVLEISTSFELSTKPAASSDRGGTISGNGSGYNFDNQAYARARLAPKRKESSAPKDEEKNDPPEESDGTDAEPIPAGINEAMLNAFGASATDVFGVLTTAGSWPLAPADPDAVVIAPDALADRVMEHSIHPEGVKTEVAQKRVLEAIKHVTSTSAELSATDWKPWQVRSRKRRLMIQPLAQRSDGLLVVSPRLCLATANIYLQYLKQGQLPWSQPAPPAALNTVLEATRDARNQALERQVSKVLADAGWRVVSNIKETKPERLAVPSLQTEIDVVAGRAGDPNIWILEVKDPTDVFALADIRRMLDRFFLDDKKPSYATQLSRKIADLAPHADSVATALELPTADPATPYQVRAMFVTREPTPAQFVGAPFPFTPLADLIETLEEPPDQP
ncbi:conserved hypothetical protein [Phycicoccus elongatus Lp2]|uniref:Uncharacterized protein n=1 Tax=Phycicoccus elongatus Lp2 TaxID=1193181 RepID=N0E3J8_9MICO|nr:hypothetical protein [Phycicoccus elongatus]CCH69464.1 conserved hypothetical protein [Phycicoccus elongatus Lp2]